jgi:excisionase family DNA binding protein
MLYYLTTFPKPNTHETQYTELEKLVKNTGRFTLHALSINGRSGLYIEVANTISTMVEMRLLPTLTGIEGSLERRQTWVHRPEWALHALLTPSKDAKDLDVSVLTGASSACLTLRWTRSGVIGDLYASADDVPLLDAITARGWEARIPPKGFAGKIALLGHRPVKTHLKPLITLFDPNQAAENASQSPLAAQTTLVVPVTPTNEPSAAIAPSESLADDLLTYDGSGLLIGMGDHGKPVGLHFRPQRLALIAGPQHEAALALLIARAFGLGAGVVAIVPNTVATLLRRSGLSERLRFLDANDPYQSASIPWRSLDPITLDAALASTGLSTSNGQGHQAASFVDLLPDYLANDETRLLTAPPGDDLRGVVAAGGGVVLVEDLNNPHLAALLLHLLIGELGRPLVVIRPDYLPLPEALESSAFDIVLGENPSHTILRELPDAWTISDADTRWSYRLQRDLQAASFSTDEGIQSALMAGLEGHEQRQAAPTLASGPNEPEAPLWDIPAFELEPVHAEEPATSDATLTWSDLQAQSIEQEREAGETVDDDVPLDDLSDELEQAPSWLKQAIEEADTREEPPTDRFGMPDEAEYEANHFDALNVADESTRVGADMELLDPPTNGFAMPDEAKYEDDPFDALNMTDESIRVGADMEPLNPPTYGIVITGETEAHGDDLQEEASEIEPLFVSEIEAPDPHVGADSVNEPELLPFEADQWSIDLGEEPEEPEEETPRRVVASHARILGRRRVGLKPRSTSQQSALVDEAQAEEADPTTNGIAETFVGPDTDAAIALDLPLAEMVAPEIEQAEPELEMPLIASLAEPEITLVAPEIEQAELEPNQPLIVPLAELVAPVIEQSEPEQPFVVPSELHQPKKSSPTTNGTANGFVGGSTAHRNGQVFQPIASAATNSEIDLAPVAELIQVAREQGQSLPSLIAQIAPHYPQVAPAALRRAVRTMLDQPSAVPATSVATPVKSALCVEEADPTTNAITEPHVVPVAVLEIPPSEDDADPPTKSIPELNVGATEEEEESTGKEQEEQPEAPSMSTTEAARFLTVAPRTVQRWADDGRLASFRDNENNRRFLESELKRFKDEREAGR